MVASANSLGPIWIGETNDSPHDLHSSMRIWAGIARDPTGWTARSVGASDGDQMNTPSRSVEDRQELAPGPDRLGVLLRHRLHDLAGVVQVVGDPCGKELAERDLAERRMDPAPPQILLAHQAGERLEVGGPDLPETIEELGERPALEAGESRLPVDG